MPFGGPGCCVGSKRLLKPKNVFWGKGLADMDMVKGSLFGLWVGGAAGSCISQNFLSLFSYFTKACQNPPYYDMVVPISFIIRMYPPYISYML